MVMKNVSASTPVDIPECARGIHECNNARCVERPGSYECECYDGFRRETEHDCVNINECETG